MVGGSGSYPRTRGKRFPWPDTDSEAMKIKEGELLMLIDGIDFFRSGAMLKLAR
jgi:hypothetical protein